MKAKLSVAGIALAMLVGVMLFPTGADANHSWGGYHWARQANPFTLKLGNNLTTADWRSHLSSSAANWNALNTAVQTTIVAGTSNKRCAMVAGTTQVCNGTYGQNGWLGLASINITGGVHITQGSAKMNDTYFNNSYYNNTNEREHVMCQEVAHTFGLGHQSEDGSSQNSCMDYFSNTGANAGSSVSTKPNAHDKDELNSIYAHLDTTTTVGFAATTSNNPFFDEDAPENWGRLVSQSANGRASYYERDNFNGTKKATHVFWTEEAADRCNACDHRYDH